MFDKARRRLQRKRHIWPVTVVPPRDVARRAPLSLEEKIERLEGDPAWTTVDLPILDAPHVTEEVLVEQVGRNLYRVASSPGMVQGLAADDLIELDAQHPARYHLVRRGLNICVHSFMQAEERDTLRAALGEQLGALGGWLDGTMGATGLCFTVPVEAGFARLEAALREVVGEEWSYSNVYDLETGEPLNWW